jgi:hypothetical protein
MSHHVSVEHFAVLALYQAQQRSIATMALVDHQITKKGRSQPCSIVGFFTIGVPYNKTDLVQE